MELKKSLLTAIEAAALTLLILLYTNEAFLYFILPIGAGFIVYAVFSTLFPAEQKVQRLYLYVLTLLAEVIVFSSFFSAVLTMQILFPMSFIAFLLAGIYFDIVYLFKEPHWSTNIIVPYALYLAFMAFFYSFI